MRVFVAGASGVLGMRVLPLLVAEGHEVWGMTRSLVKVDGLRRLDVEPIVCDVHDGPTLRAEMVAVRPEAMVNLLSDLPDMATRNEDDTPTNARTRRESCANLLAAARAAGVSRFLAQSVAWPLRGDGGRAVAELERAVLNVGGVVLRYGRLYGPGTPHARPPDAPHVHVDEAARRTATALDARSGIVEIVDPPG